MSVISLEGEAILKTMDADRYWELCIQETVSILSSKSSAYTGN